MAGVLRQLTSGGDTLRVAGEGRGVARLQAELGTSRCPSSTHRMRFSGNRWSGGYCWARGGLRSRRRWLSCRYR